MPAPEKIVDDLGQYKLQADAKGYRIDNTVTGGLIHRSDSTMAVDPRTHMQCAHQWLESEIAAGRQPPVMADAPPAPKVVTLDEYQKQAMTTAVFNKENLYYPFLGLAGESGEVCELAKKAMRDEKGVWSDERKAKLKLELGDVMWYVAAIAQQHGLTLEEVAQANVDKLNSRKFRGKLGGSGDHR